MVRAPKGVLLLSVLFILLGTALRTLHKVLASALPPSHIPTPWGLTTACTFNTLKYIVNHQWLLQQNDDANQLRKCILAMFQKTFNRLALLCVIRLGSYTQQLHNKTPNDQELQFSFSSYMCQF